MPHYKQAELKDTSLRFRLETELHDEFLTICKLHNVSAAKVLREYMKAYIATHRNRLDEESSMEE